MKNMWRLIILVLFITTMVFAQTRITVLFTNNINGELQNCLCEDQPNGALEKLAFQTESIRQGTENILLLDAGDFYTPFGDVEKNVLLRKAQDILNYDAIIPGDQAFASGVRFFNSAILPGLGNLAVINLRLLNELVGKPQIFKYNELNIAVIGIVGEHVFKFYESSKIRGLSIDEPGQLLQNQIDKLKDEVDCFIVLSHQGLDDDLKLATEVKGIDLIIGAHSQNEVLKPRKIGQTYIVQAGGNAQNLGRVYLDFSENSILHYIEADPVVLTRDLPNHPEMVKLAISDSYRNIQVYMRASNLAAEIKHEYLVASASECASCHTEQYEAWQKTAHAHSLKILQEKKKINFLKCVNCHVTGFGRQDGFINVNLTAEFARITCTECHLTLPRHMSSTLASDVIKINKQSCIRCHDVENDLDFNFERDIETIRH